MDEERFMLEVALLNLSSGGKDKLDAPPDVAPVGGRAAENVGRVKPEAEEGEGDGEGEGEEEAAGEGEERRGERLTDVAEDVKRDR